jgi:hypothetical protein
MDCNCPQSSALTEIITEDCEVNLGQIQKIAIQRAGDMFDSAGTPTPSDILLESVWQTKLSATDSTKIVLTPFIGGDPVIEPGEAITVGGGDNSTLNGVAEVQGVNPSNFTAVFKGLSAVTEKAMKALMCEKNLVVYLFLQGGKIGVIKVSATQYKGFPIQSFFVSDRGNQGFGTKDVVNVSFALAEGWSSDLTIIDPTWNPLVDLVA